MKYITTTGSPPGFLALLVGAMMLGLVSTSALAAGTPAGTDITNIAKLSYDVGGVAQGDICSSPTGNSTADDDGFCVPTQFGAANTIFRVDNKVDVLVTEGNTTFTTVAAGQTGAITTFTVKNQGNKKLDFALATNNISVAPNTLFTKTDDFNMLSCAVSSIVYTSGGTGMDANGATLNHINGLTPDAIATVQVSCDVPAAQANNSFAIVYLKATASDFDGVANTAGATLLEAVNVTTTEQNVFGDVAGTDDTTGALDGEHSARDAYFVQTATITVTKTMTTLCDPVTGTAAPHNIPGGIVRWTITIANAAGGASANLASISDGLSTDITLDPDLITGFPGTAAACEFAAGGAGTPESANTRSVRIQNSVARPMLGTPGGSVVSSHFVADVGDANADGVSSTSGVSVDFATAFPAGGTYGAGELKAGETVTVYFNVGIN